MVYLSPFGLYDHMAENAYNIDPPSGRLLVQKNPIVPPEARYDFQFWSLGWVVYFDKAVWNRTESDPRGGRDMR